MKKQHLYLLITCLLLTAAATSCAPELPTTNKYGFFSGIIHGLVFPFALVSKLFNMNYGLHAFNNTGFFYWLGYIIGFGALGSSGIFAGRKK